MFIYYEGYAYFLGSGAHAGAQTVAGWWCRLAADPWQMLGRRSILGSGKTSIDHLVAARERMSWIAVDGFVREGFFY